MTIYTLEDFAAARMELENWIQRSANYSGNNPNKYQADLRSARERVRAIEAALKADGVIALTEKEKLEIMLDRLFPKARSKAIVEYEGQRYQRRFTPLERSRSRKTVTTWRGSWVRLEEPHLDDS